MAEYVNISCPFYKTFNFSAMEIFTQFVRYFLKCALCLLFEWSFSADALDKKFSVMFWLCPAAYLFTISRSSIAFSHA